MCLQGLRHPLANLVFLLVVLLVLAVFLIERIVERFLLPNKQ